MLGSVDLLGSPVEHHLCIDVCSAYWQHTNYSQITYTDTWPRARRMQAGSGERGKSRCGSHPLVSQVHYSDAINPCCLAGGLNLFFVCKLKIGKSQKTRLLHNLCDRAALMRRGLELQI